MKITGKNSAIGQSAEDIITAGGTFSEPTQARIHAVVSSSEEDDSSGTLQEETATVVGTIAGILQVETATIVGTIGAAGEGNASVTVSSSLIGETPVEVSVAVANNDNASAVAGKIRTALNSETGITDHYTVGGTGADVTLTAKVAAANDATLNIAYDNDTCSGLTPDATSANTTAGHPGTGNASVVITSADLEDSPITVPVAVLVGDNAAAVAGKIRTALNANTDITEVFTVGGTSATVKLTKKVKAANDATLNIAIDNDTCNGLTTAATSTDTTAGVQGTGAHTVVIIGINELGSQVTELVYLNGTASVNTTNKFIFINSMRVKTAGSGGKNAGAITATAAVDNTVSSKIEIGKNKAQQAIFYATRDTKISNFYAAVYNSTAGAQTNFELLKKKIGEVWEPVVSFDLNSTNYKIEDKEGWLFEKIEKDSMIKFSAVASAGSSSVIVNFDIS